MVRFAKKQVFETHEKNTYEGEMSKIGSKYLLIAARNFARHKCRNIQLIEHHRKACIGRK